ncbi:MAG: hypothetical protein QMD85_01825 [Candidatus Aenigmarchaeota archaeon]|nr:hypothetical protein [Candidatus Aenigmarchaeota archaeon]
MKKMLFILAIILVAAVVYAANVSVSRSFPSMVDPNGVLTVSVVITPGEQIAGFDIAEFIPRDWSVASWDVAGYSKNDVSMDSQSREYGGKTYKAYHWAFKKAFSTVTTLTYTINVPVSSGTFNFASVWTYPGGFSSDTKILTVATAPPVQQPPSPVCGNNARETGEECDGTDMAGQTCASKGFASGTLKCTSCRFDTGSCVSAPVCGDNVCDASETCSSCSSDCGVCPPEQPQPPNTAYYLIGAAIVIVLLGMWLKFSKRGGKKKQ